MNYGMPYQGSKNKIVRWLMDVLPPADVFVDLFGGGGAVSHAALLSGKYRRVIYNELEPLVAKGFDMAVHGKFKGEDRWISREDFIRLKDTDPYAAICFSFGNNCKNYMYSPDMEAYKKALHELIFWRQTDNIMQYPFAEADAVKRLCDIDDRHGRRLAYRTIVLTEAVKSGKCIKRGAHWYADTKQIDNLQSLESLESLARLERLQSPERLERLERLESLERLQSLEIYNTSYENVPIPENAVVYCDIPYRNTKGYNEGGFDHERFYEWALSRPYDVYISEYSMPDNFCEVDNTKRQGCMSTVTSKATTERLFCNHKKRSLICEQIYFPGFIAIKEDGAE